MRSLLYPLIFLTGALVAFLVVWHIQLVSQKASLFAALVNASAVACSLFPNIWAARQSKNSYLYVGTYVLGQGVGAYARMGLSTGVWTW